VKVPAGIFELYSNGKRRSIKSLGLKCRDGFSVSESTMISCYIEQLS